MTTNRIYPNIPFQSIFGPTDDILEVVEISPAKQHRIESASYPSSPSPRPQDKMERVYNSGGCASAVQTEPTDPQCVERIK